MNHAKKLEKYLIKINLQSVNQILNGIGQIMLQENIITGLLFSIGVFIANYKMGIALIFATFIATLIAKLLNFEKSDINKGLYGFNAALVGVACILFFNPSFITFCAIIGGATLSTIIQHFFLKRKLAFFTLPFVLTTWLIYILIKYLSPETMLISNNQIQLDFINIWVIPIRGFGQVIFQSSIIAGSLFILGVLTNSILASIYGIIAAIISASIAYLLNIEIQSIYLGLFSFNAVLCAIALKSNKFKDILWLFFAIIFSLIISFGLSKLNLLQLTFPFVAATYITIVLKNKLYRL